MRVGKSHLAIVLVASLYGGRVSASPLVVLDPGHGGPHPGTKSADGLEEKDLVLTIAMMVKAQLTRNGVRVRLTRTDDRHVPLAARPAMAHKLSADAFVSIHINYAPDVDRRGWETYVLSAEASDALTQKLLTREEGDEQMTNAPVAASDLSFILGDLSRGRAHEQSARLAKSIQDAVEGVPGLSPSRGLRQAPFMVLTGAKIPAVLVEMGYLSNPTQAKFLSSPKGQKEAARSITRGLINFLGFKRKRSSRLRTWGKG